MTQTSIAIEANDIWKIFGPKAQDAMEAVRQRGLSKAEVLEEFNCVVGVADTSFTVTEGEIFCIMGLSGSGKSTLVRHVNRLLEPTAGRITVFGQDVTSLNQADLRRMRNEHIAMVFQNFGLMPHRTVRDNVATPLEIRGESKTTRWFEAERVLELVNLDGWGDKYAHELSGGMQQRVGLARAIAADPKILLMDEPFSALDPLIRRQLQDQFMELSHRMNKTTLFITHDLDEAIRIGHRIAIMKDGQIIQIGTPEEIVANPADDYVADFVSGISRLGFVRAESIMQSVDLYQAQHGPIAEDVPHMNAEASLDQLLEEAIRHDGPIRINDPDGQTVGIVDRRDILQAVKGEGEPS